MKGRFNPFQKLKEIGKNIRRNIEKVFNPKKETETAKPKEPKQPKQPKIKPVVSKTKAEPKQPKPEQPKPQPTQQQKAKVQAQKKKVQYEPQKQQKVRQDNVNKDTSFYAKAIISNYKNQLEQYPAMAEPMLKNWLEYMILSHGEEAVATMLQDGAENGIILSFEIAYSEEKLVGYIADLMDWLPEMTDWYKAELMEQFETWDDVL